MEFFGDGSCSVNHEGNRSREYSCVRRLRHRRLITFLRVHGFGNTYRSLIHETDVFLSIGHVRELVEQGLWSEAISYLKRFVPANYDRPIGLEGLVLLSFLQKHKEISDILAGTKECASVCKQINHTVDPSTLDQPTMRLRSICLSLISSQEFRDSLDWGCVRLKASAIITDLAHQVPELKDLVLLPNSPMEPHDVLPIGFGLSLSGNCQELRLHERIIKAKEWLADIIEESIRAGQPPCQVYPSRSVSKEGAPDASVSQTMFGTLTSPAHNSGIFSVKNGGKQASIPGCYTESACQDFNPRKNLRASPEIAGEDCKKKRQRTTEAFGGPKLEGVLPG